MKFYIVAFLIFATVTFGQEEGPPPNPDGGNGGNGDNGGEELEGSALGRPIKLIILNFYLIKIFCLFGY